MACVTEQQKKSQEYRDAMKRFDITSDELEVILHKYQNDPKNQEAFSKGELSFPSDEYLQEQLSAPAITVSNPEFISYWEEHYSKPMVYTSLKDAQNDALEAMKVFGKSVFLRKLASGGYKLSVTRPKLGKNENVLYHKNSHRASDLNTVKTYYARSIAQGVNEKLALCQQLKQTIFKDIQISPYENEDTDEEMIKRADNKIREIRNTYGPLISNVYKFKLPNGNFKIQVNFKTSEQFINDALSVIEEWSDEQLASEALRIENETSFDIEYYINPKQIEEIRTQIAKKSIQSETAIMQAVSFLEELANTPENNLYVKTCIQWLKNDSIVLPRDNERVRQLFDYARTHNIDIQKCKTPFDIYIKTLKEKGSEEGRSINPNDYQHISFSHTFIRKDGVKIDVYNVENSSDGQTDVVNILAKASPKFDGNPVPSPWCLSTFNYNSLSGKATPTESAKHFWQHYNAGKRQIAFVDNKPIAFNSSEINKDTWWDFYDAYPGAETLDDIDISSADKIYKSYKPEKYHIEHIGPQQIDYDGKTPVETSLMVRGTDAEVVVHTLDGRQGTTHRVRVNYGNKKSVTFTLEKDELEVHQDGLAKYELTNSIEGITFTQLFGLNGGDTQYTREGIILGKAKSGENKGKIIAQYRGKVWIFDKHVFNPIRKASESSGINTKEEVKNLKSVVTTLYNQETGAFSNLNALQKAIEASKSVFKTTPLTVSKEFIDFIDKIKDEIGKVRKAKGRALTLQGYFVDKNNTPEFVEAVDALMGNYIRSTFREDERKIGNDVATGNITGNSVDNAYIMSEDFARRVQNYQLEYPFVTPEDVVNTFKIFKQGEVTEAYKRAVQLPVQKELSSKLRSILEKYHFEYVETAVQEAFGDDVTGALDLLQKVVYLANEKDRTAIEDVEEFSHAFIELMGSAYRRPEIRDKFPENELYSELRDLIEQTALYKQTFEEYKEVYVLSNGNPDLTKIKKEALGKALSGVIVDNYSKQDKTFFDKLKKWWTSFLNYIKSIFGKPITNDKGEETELYNYLNEIADSILNGSYEAKYLNKFDASEYTLATAEEKITPTITAIISKIKDTGAIVTGSLSAMQQGTLYRKDSRIHDLDIIIPSDVINNVVQDFDSGIDYVLNGYSDADRRDFSFLQVTEAFQNHFPHHINKIVPTIVVPSEYSYIIDRARTEKNNATEENPFSVKDFLESLNEEERDHVVSIDFMFDSRRHDAIPLFVKDDTQYAGYTEIFDKKLRFGRAKDIFDYQMYNPQRREFASASIKHTLDDTLFHIKEGSNKKEVIPEFVYHYSDEENLNEFIQKEDNYFSKFKGGTKNAIFFTDNPNPTPNTVLDRKARYKVKLSANKVKVIRGTKEDLHARGTSYTEEVNKAEQEGYDAVRFIGIDDNQEINQNITIIFNPKNATIVGKTIKNKSGQFTTISPTEVEIYNGNWTRNEVEEETSEKLSSRDQAFYDNQRKLSTSIDNLIGINSVFSNSEIDEAAQDVAFNLSYMITQMQENPSLITETFGIEINKDDVSKLSRLDLVKKIGLQNLLDYCRISMFNPLENNAISDEMVDKAFLLLKEKNFDTLVLKCNSTFAFIEGWGIKLNEVGKAEVDENVDTSNEDNFNESQNTTEVAETQGNAQEHWQVDTNTLSVISTMSQQIKQFLANCYKLDKEGNQVLSAWGVPQRMNVSEATAQILSWTQGSLNRPQMVKLLTKHANSNPWINQVLEKLNDASGDNAIFQAQFFNSFARHHQSYAVATLENGSYVTKIINTSSALKDAFRNIESAYKVGQHPLFTSKGVNSTTYGKLISINDELSHLKYSEEEKEHIANLLADASTILGYPTTKEQILEILDEKSFKTMTSDSLKYIVSLIGANKNNPTWEPFSRDPKKQGILNNIGRFIKPLTDILEATTVHSFYSKGKMYQSDVLPSYLSDMLDSFNKEDKVDENNPAEPTEFAKWLNHEFGRYSQFRDASRDKGNLNEDLQRGWRNEWLRLLVTDPKARELLDHKVQLTFNNHSYMLSESDSQAMLDNEYLLSVVTEYFSETNWEKQESLVPAWFRIPMMSNKASAEYIRFYSYRGNGYQDEITKGLKQFFDYELSRIQTVRMRGLNKEQVGYIDQLDENGKHFCFLPFLNKYVEGKENSKLGTLIKKKVSGEELTTEEEVKLNDLALKAIKYEMNLIAKNKLQQWQRDGIVDAAIKSIKGITKENALEQLENFIWNDMFAAKNILQLTITDIAQYKSAEDLQKRLKELQAPGTKADIFATDFNGDRVSDGINRTLYISDISGEAVKSDLIENLRIVFNNKLALLDPNSRNYAIAKQTYDEILRQYSEDINVTDGQAYSSLSSMRKKMFMFGKWSREAEDFYNKVKAGRWDHTDFQTHFNPLKPFTYSQTSKSTGVNNAPISNFKLGVQNKNSEYMLLIAGAILEEAGQPNILQVLSDVMEDSVKKVGADKCLDSIQFESAVKTGITGVIDITSFINKPNGAEALKTYLEKRIYNDDGTYNALHVHELNYEDFKIQQDIPDHFIDHFQAWGSQIRMITPSDLDINSSFTYTDGTTQVTKNGAEFRKEYEKNAAESIQESLDEVIQEFNLDGTPLERNIALARILQREILSSPRYGMDLLVACSLNENGEFRIPLNDPIQSKRIEQLLNSIIKNRVNKQEIAGGPVVQVTNFGTSRRLHIRFNDKQGNLLKNLEEYQAEGHSEEEWKRYIEDNQGGIAYYEVYAPATHRKFFEDFTDENGVIDVKAIEKLNPDLLKMIGYRIPTEDKYSTFPCKIVGFMPSEAGEAIMLPYEITLITGSDRNNVVVSTSII